MDVNVLRRVCGYVLLSCLVLGLAWTAPLEEVAQPRTSSIPVEGLFQGDMLLGVGRNGLVARESHWPNATVHYKISPEFNEKQVIHILKAMEIIQNVSCVRFVPAPDEITAYVLVNVTTSGCYSHIGYIGHIQTINLESSEVDNGCFVLGILQHELLHTLGFHHQHSSSDRDEYVSIDWDNIKDIHKSNFVKLNSNLLSNFGARYDYSSIMHYQPIAFRMNENNVTIHTMQNAYGKTLGQRYRMSDSDITRLNNMYSCKRPKPRTVIQRES